MTLSNSERFILRGHPGTSSLLLKAHKLEIDDKYLFRRGEFPSPAFAGSGIWGYIFPGFRYRSSLG
jgi:hypothetical protein